MRIHSQSPIIVVFLGLALHSAAVAQTLTYVGRVRLPQEGTEFARAGLAVRTHPTKGYREIISLNRKGEPYGVRMPDAWDDSVATGSIHYGSPEYPADHTPWNLGFDHTGELLLFHAPFYPASELPTLPSITRYTLTATGLENKRGPFAIPGVHFHRRQGGALVLPEAIAARHNGRRTVVGFGGYYNITQGTSPGTCAYAVDLDNWQASPLIEFPWAGGAKNEPRRGDYENSDTFGTTIDPTGPGDFEGTWQLTDTRVGGAWSRGLWVAGFEATGRVRYSAEGGQSGFHADAFKTFVRFYPEADLVELWNGQCQPQQLRPRYWRLEEIPGVPANLGTSLTQKGDPNINPDPKLTGVAIEDDLLLIAAPLDWGGMYNEYPAIHAFRIRFDGSAPPAARKK